MPQCEDQAGFLSQGADSVLLQTVGRLQLAGKRSQVRRQADPVQSQVIEQCEQVIGQGPGTGGTDQIGMGLQGFNQNQSLLLGVPDPDIRREVGQCPITQRLNARA